MVHWLIHLHELSTRHPHLRELLVAVAVTVAVAITILGLRCRVVLEHLLIEKVWVHEHLLVWESHLIRHHHAIWELVHLTHLIHDWRRLWHATRCRHISVVAIRSLVIQILSLSVLSQFSLTVSV
jgi:hypothetical protein